VRRPLTKPRRLSKKIGFSRFTRGGRSMTFGGRALGLFLGSTVALLACSSDKSPGTGAAGAAGSAGAIGSAGSASSSAGSAGSSAGAAGSPGSAGSTAADQGGGSAQMQTDPCANGVKDGSESDVDCGSDCSQCANGKTCVAFSDCSSSHCVNGTCQECAPNATQCDDNKVATCTDGKWVDAATDCPNGCDVNTSMCKP
jgi:hypothetical protein